MRVTIWLLLEHVKIDDLALLIESYILPDVCDITGEWFPSLTSGHMEHIQDCLTDRKYLDMIMYQACEIGDIAMINQLIVLGEKDWNNGFIAAKLHNQVEAARIMIDHGADVNYVDPNHSAIQSHVGAELEDRYDYDFVPMCKLLIDNGFTHIEEMILPIVQRDDIELLKTALPKLHLDVTLSLLKRAGQYNSIRVIEFYIKIFGQQNQQSVANMIMESAGIDISVDVIKYLLTLGADPNIGMNVACHNGQKKALALLFAAGARCTCGKTNDEHTDEYTNLNHIKSQRQYFDSMLHSIGVKRARESDD